MDMKVVAYVMGVILGTFVLVSVCVVWIRHQKLGPGGAGMALIGVVLVGLPIWSRVTLNAGEWKAEFETLRGQVQEVAEAGAALAEETSKVAQSAELSRRQVLNLAQTLEKQRLIPPEQTRALRESLQNPVTIQPEVFRRLSRDLSTMQKQKLNP